jgi:ketosteroid isomerase-like protein
VANKYAAALTNETLPQAGIYASNATWDYWPEDNHIQGAAEIEGVYKAAGVYCDWSQSHVLTAPGVAACEGVLTVTDEGTSSLPSLSLSAVDGNKIAHEEVFLDPGPESKKAVTFYGTAPRPKDTAKVAAEVATAVGDAFASGDVASLQTLLAPDILFYDTGLRRGVQGVDAVLAWQAKTPTVDVTNQGPMAGQGWAVVRWTVREAYSTGVEVAMPGATVMEVRDGKVVRMTLYYDSELISLQG